MTKILFTRPVFGSPEREILKGFADHPEKLLADHYLNQARSTLTELYGVPVLPTHSCAAALEMVSLLLNIQPGDEVIVPTYTFVATANPFAIRGAKIRFVDMRSDTFNIDETQIESAIHAKTRAIVVMHYAGVGCQMARIQALAEKYQLPVIEDAAQCFDAKWDGKRLGTFGTFGVLSFHNTKNLTSGLGGALIINDERFVERAKVLWQRGTNREAYLEGQVDKYTWVDLGSSFVMSELSAGLLVGQLERRSEILAARLEAWNAYHEAFKPLESLGFLRPFLPENAEHNGHVYYLIAPSENEAKAFRAELNARGISSSSHYVPLHLSPGGQKYAANPQQSFPTSESLHARICRLPLYEGVEIRRVISEVLGILNS